MLEKTLQYCKDTSIVFSNFIKLGVVWIGFLVNLCIPKAFSLNKTGQETLSPKVNLQSITLLIIEKNTLCFQFHLEILTKILSNPSCMDYLQSVKKLHILNYV